MDESLTIRTIGHDGQLRSIWRNTPGKLQPRQVLTCAVTPLMSPEFAELRWSRRASYSRHIMKNIFWELPIMKTLRLLFTVVLISSFTALGCSDDGTSSNPSDNNGADTGNQSADAGEDTGNQSADSGGDTSESSSFIPEANSSGFAIIPWTDEDVNGTYAATAALFSDHADFCSAWRDSCEAARPEFEARSMAFTLIAAEQYKTGTYTIDPNFDESNLTSNSMVGEARIQRQKVGEDDPEIDASSGTITVTTFSAQELIGTYELTFEGTEYTGSFDIDFCQKLQDDFEC